MEVGRGSLGAFVGGGIPQRPERAERSVMEGRAKSGSVTTFQSLRNGSEANRLPLAEAGTSRCHCKERRGPGGCLRTVLVKIELACVPTAKSPSLVIYKAGSRRVYKCFCVRDV